VIAGAPGEAVSAADKALLRRKTLTGPLHCDDNDPGMNCPSGAHIEKASWPQADPGAPDGVPTLGESANKLCM
jgi:hypothetical protein